MEPLSFMTYDKKLKLWVVRYLSKYLKTTKAFWKIDYLFLTFIKQHRKTTKVTMSMWCKLLLKTVNNYSSYSARVAASPYAKSNGESIYDWLCEKQVGHQKKCGKFYDKKI